MDLEQRLLRVARRLGSNEVTGTDANVPRTPNPWRDCIPAPTGKLADDFYTIKYRPHVTGKTKSLGGRYPDLMKKLGWKLVQYEAVPQVSRYAELYVDLHMIYEKDGKQVYLINIRKPLSGGAYLLAGDIRTVKTRSNVTLTTIKDVLFDLEDQDWDNEDTIKLFEKYSPKVSSAVQTLRIPGSYAGPMGELRGREIIQEDRLRTRLKKNGLDIVSLTFHD